MHIFCLFGVLSLWINLRCPKQVLDQGPYHPATENGPAPWPMEPAKQVANGHQTMPQQHA